MPSTPLMSALTRPLRPRPGHRLPRRLRFRHVGAIVRSIPEGLRAPAFGELLCRLDDGGELHGSQAVAVYQDGEQATKAMLAAVAAVAIELMLHLPFTASRPTSSYPRGRQIDVK